MNFLRKLIPGSSHHEPIEKQEAQELGPIHTLPIELLELIFSNLTALEMDKASGTCKLWRNLTNSKCDPLKFVQKGLTGQLNLKDLSWLIAALIRKRQGSENDETIMQLCTRAAEDSRLEQDFSVEEFKAIQAMPAVTRIFVGTGQAMMTDITRCQTSFSSNKIPNCMHEARKTNPMAQFLIGLSKYSNKTRKIAMLNAASKKGVAAATYILHSIQKSEEKSIEKLELAGKQGSSAAYFLLAHICNNNQDISTEYFKLAAERGHKFAQYVLGKNLVATDKVEAVQWLGKAAIRGVPAAQILLGELLEEGVEGAEKYVQELISEGIDPIHVENGRFFQKHATVKAFSEAEAFTYDDYTNTTDPIAAGDLLEKIKALKSIIQEHVDKTV